MNRTTFQYTKEFDEQFAYHGHDLGVVCRHGVTCFKVWAPFAQKVELCLYKENKDEPFCHEMVREEKGVWSKTFSESLHGTYYEYQIWTDDESVRTNDPYATACGCNSNHSMVVDLSLTDPEGFSEDRAPEREPENIIYELHIKDFSFDPDSGVPEAYRGKYKAFTIENPGEDYPTGVRYLKELGITHVHLLPFYDYGWLDERGSDEQYNWGYDPVNYNVPEGSYATDVSDGTVRIRECKEMIQALHRAGIRVVMDVVYNHTYESDLWQERTAPGYYYRHEKDGTLSDGSACGNDIAVGRAMVDHYIADSVMYWAKEYHIDGFRFDLMGLLTTELMNRIRRELDAEFGEGEKLLYGEPWRAKESPMEEGTHAALKKYISLLDDGIAVFSDDTRDVIKGDVFHPELPGFVNGNTGLGSRVLGAVTGWRHSGSSFRPKSCKQVVHYVSAHDNHTLWDKLLYTVKVLDTKKSEDFYLTPYKDVLAANKLAAMIYFTCQGNLFLQAGEEFGRTKFGNDNSYRSNPRINMLRWRQTQVFGRLFSYYKGLIALRKKLSGLCDKSPDAYKRIYDQKIYEDGIVSFRVDNLDEKREISWEELFIIYNASDRMFSSEITAGHWQILADDMEANCCKKIKERICVPAHSGVIAGRRREET